MVKKSILWAVLIFLFSCEMKKETESIVRDNENDINSLEMNYIPMKNFQGQNLIERKAISKIKEYLKSKDMSLDSFYIWKIEYPDTSSIETIHDNSYSVIIDLTHEKTINYIDSIIKLNSRLSSKNKDEELSPMTLPPTGNISGKDRAIYYYFKEDTIVDVLSQ